MGSPPAPIRPRTKSTSVTDPLGRVTTATYDPAGRQLSQTDPDGHTTTWAYDAAGREASTSVDGALITAIERDLAGRRVVITDHTGGAGYAVEHELCFDRRGLLTRKSNGNGTGRCGWEYDADGNRTAFTDPTGTTTRYTRDAAGRVVKVSNPLLGDAAFTHDASGRITTATAGQPGTGVGVSGREPGRAHPHHHRQRHQPSGCC